MKAKSGLFLLLVLFSFSAVSEQENCDDRIAERVPPKWVKHSERILEKLGSCSINVIYDLSAEASISGIDSFTEIEDCKRFQKSAENSVSLYRFKEGENQKCITKLTFALESNGT